MAFAATRCPDETHFYAASLEDPADFVPDVHHHHDEKLPWIHLEDGLAVVDPSERDGTD
jgi:hypothetical protein